MLTDAFFRRYEDVALWEKYTERERVLLNQAAQLITSEVYPASDAYKNEDDNKRLNGLRDTHVKIAREVGLTQLENRYYSTDRRLPNGNTVSTSVRRTIQAMTTIWLTKPCVDQAQADRFMKQRISFIEVAFQEKARDLRSRQQRLLVAMGHPNSAIALLDSLSGQSYHESEKASLLKEAAEFDAYVFELNERLRQARMPLSYHNDILQVSDDAMIEAQVERPFWSAIGLEKWSTIDELMKEAIDKRDRRERDAVTPALQAVEGVIKIISNEKGWTTGNERGAANFINNLVPERDGKRFISVWEKDALITLFSSIRNNFGHAPGGEPLPTLLPQQTEWVIRNCMTWIKSLVDRT